MPQKLIDIKDADGEALIIQKAYRKGEILYSDKEMINFAEGYNSALEEQSQRQVAVEVDREKLATEIYKITSPHLWKEYGFMQHYGDCPNDEACYAYKMADEIIAHQQELFKIIYVKD